MPISVSPRSDVKSLHNKPKISTFLFQIVPDSTFKLFGGIDSSPERGYKILIEGLLFYRNPTEWCQTMSKMIVPIPTLFQPISLQLHIVTTVEEEETWVGFYLKVEEIRTLKTYNDWAYFNLKIKSPYGNKRAKYVKYSPSENCYGWSKFFKLNVMQNCGGNPFILDIVLDHEPMPCIFRFPYICSEDIESQDEIENFTTECERISLSDDNGGDESINTTMNSNSNTANAIPNMNPSTNTIANTNTNTIAIVTANTTSISSSNNPYTLNLPSSNCDGSSSNSNTPEIPGIRKNKKKYKKFSSADHIYCNNTGAILPLMSSSQGHVPGHSLSPNHNSNHSHGHGHGRGHHHPQRRRPGHSNQNRRGGTAS